MHNNSIIINIHPQLKKSGILSAIKKTCTDHTLPFNILTCTKADNHFIENLHQNTHKACIIIINDTITQDTLFKIYMAQIFKKNAICLAIDITDKGQNAFHAIKSELGRHSSIFNMKSINIIPFTRSKDANEHEVISTPEWFKNKSLLDQIKHIASQKQAKATKTKDAADHFLAHIMCTSTPPLFSGRPYMIAFENSNISGTISEIKHIIKDQELNKRPAKFISEYEIGTCNLHIHSPILFSQENPTNTTFQILDMQTNDVIGLGVLDFALYRATNLRQQNLKINKDARITIKNQKSCVLWFSGLSGSGKSTIADLTEQKLYALGKHTYILDGDNVRHGLNRDLGFTNADRIENIRRIGEVAKLMVDAGLITIVSFISPFQSERNQARALMKQGEFIEVFVDTPIQECERRDTKGLYKKARMGDLKNFTGISSPYEEPQNPELHLKTLEHSAEKLSDYVISYLQKNGII